jgi:hypothetical protein
MATTKKNLIDRVPPFNGIQDACDITHADSRPLGSLMGIFWDEQGEISITIGQSVRGPGIRRQLMGFGGL